jgi:hypothetical protein
MASGLLDGLVESLSDETRVQINRKSRSLGSVWRGSGDNDDDLKAIDNDLSRDTPHIIVVLQGLVDRQSWRAPGGRRFAIGSDEWKTEYARRLDRVMRTFRRKGVAVYWVGHAIMRRQDVSEDAQMINEVIRERAYVNGLKFIDVYASFADESGNFSTSGPDITGKSRTLREYDGSDYTYAGYRKLAHFVERELKRDLAQARNERTIPLAGSEAEQKRIRPQKAAEAAPPNTAAPAERPAAAPAVSKRPSAAEKAAARRSNLTAAAVNASGDLQGDTSRITLKSLNPQGKEESVTLDILRPAIPAAVVAVITRRESAEKNSQMGDSLMTEILGGLTVVTSVTPVSEVADRRKVSPTNALYYRVLVKGERLQPKPGRSDDMPWPRQETLPAAKAESTPADGASPAAPDGLHGRPVPARQGRSRG